MYTDMKLRADYCKISHCCCDFISMKVMMCKPMSCFKLCDCLQVRYNTYNKVVQFHNQFLSVMQLEDQWAVG